MNFIQRKKGTFHNPKSPLNINNFFNLTYSHLLTPYATHEDDKALKKNIAIHKFLSSIFGLRRSAKKKINPFYDIIQFIQDRVSL